MKKGFELADNVGLSELTQIPHAIKLVFGFYSIYLFLQIYELMRLIDLIFFLGFWAFLLTDSFCIKACGKYLAWDF